MVEGGIYPQTQLGTSGDYCGYYRVGEQLLQQTGTDESGNTGFKTPTPYSAYQEGNKYETVCQASGAGWGQELRKASPGNNCWETCGMNHYVSFGSQGLNDRPWSGWFGSPTFVVSGDATPQIFTHLGANVGAWGYLCPVLEDATTGNVLEYCFQEWRSSYNTAEWSNERIGTCASAGGKSIDTVQTMFWPGTRYATELAGSANTFALGSAGWRHYTAGITSANLQAAISDDVSKCAPRNLSTNPANWAVIGVEHGIEGWRELTELGGASNNLQLRTEYTPRPSASTESATGVTKTGATLNGAVNPNGNGTHYHFEYGTTSSYGSSTAEGDAGAGSSPVSVSATIASLFPGTTYHFRLVASSAGGVSYGSDRVFQTAMATPSAIKPSSGQDVYYLAANSSGSVSQWDWNGSAWNSGALGGEATGDLSAIVATYGQDVYYRGADGAIWNWDWNGSAWSKARLGGEAAGDPTAIKTPGGIDVYYRGTDGAIWNFDWNGSSWSKARLGGEAAGDPTAIVMPHGLDVYYRGTDGAIWNFDWNGSAWSKARLGGEAAGDPTAINDPGGADVYYRGTDGAIWNFDWNGSAWSKARLGGEAAGVPTAIVMPNGLDVYYRGTDGAIWNFDWNGSAWSKARLGGEAASDPSAIATSNGGVAAYYQRADGTIWKFDWNGSAWTNTAV
jgi:hypothetical protein